MQAPNGQSIPANNQQNITMFPGNTAPGTTPAQLASNNAKENYYRKIQLNAQLGDFEGKSNLNNILLGNQNLTPQQKSALIQQFIQKGVNANVGWLRI